MTTGHSWDSSSFKQLWRHGVELQHRVAALLSSHRVADKRFFAAIEQLHGEVGDDLYAELFFHLARRKFSPQRAASHWLGLRQLHESMAARLGEPIDIRAALVTYLIRTPGEGGDPMIIDVAQFDELQDILLVDELTGLPNYRYLTNALDHEIRRAEQWGYTVSLLILNIDDFAFYNQKNGHEAANDVLVQLARKLKRLVRPSDLAARYGGDEFVLVYPATSKAAAHDLALALQKNIHETTFPHGKAQPSGELTVSMGLAAFPADGRSAFELIRRADAAKYAAQKSGKNRVILYGDNRRSHGRVATNLSGQLMVAADRQGTTFRTRNISEAGLLLLTSTPLPVDALLDIRLALGESEPPVVCPARVVRSQPMAGGGYQSGVHFVAPGTEDHQRLVRYIAQQRKHGDGFEDESNAA